MEYESERKVSAGSYDLNKFLYGGYEKGVITTFYGPAGTGKTNLCMFAVASQVKKGNKVIYLDTEGGFSIDRLKQIIGSDYKTALQNVILLKATSFEEQVSATAKILAELKNKGRMSIIVVDSMTMLYRLKLGEAENDSEKIKKINSELIRQLRMLAEIARKHNIPVLVTNQVYFDFSTSREESPLHRAPEMHMVGGDILKYWSKCLLEVKNNGKRSLIIRKHRSLPESSLSFVITDSEIKKRGWI